MPAVLPAKRKDVAAKRLTASVVMKANDVFGEVIGATSMRTLYDKRGVNIGGSYELEDAEGFFPDKAVEFLAAGYGRFGPNKNKSGPEG